VIVEVKLFAAARQLAGADSISVELPDAPTVGDLRSALVARAPALAGLVARAMFAVNAEYAPESTLIPAGAEVACIPPVSGG
jgi:molybdopterin converting factor subunit 1